MILANDFQRQWADTGSSVLDAVRTVGESGWYILGQEVAAFEQELAAWWALPHAVGVASGLDALELGLRVSGCGPGDKVLTTPLSAFATTLAILKLGATPVFADCDERGLIDLAACRRILQQDAGIRFFVPVHLYGFALDLDALQQLRDDFQLQIVEDCAQSIGATFRGRPTGTVGQLAATSFYPTKNLGALGDAGAVLTVHAEYARAIRQLRDYGQSTKYRHESVGYNSRLDELHAAILRRACLPRLTEWTERRRAIAGLYHAQIRNPHLTLLPSPAHVDSCCHLFPVTVHAQQKAAALQHLRAHGVQAGEHYPLPIPDQPALAGLPWSGELSRARCFAASQISLPIHPYLTSAEAGEVARVCNAWTP